jgi:hypothetical protein
VSAKQNKMRIPKLIFSAANKKILLPAQPAEYGKHHKFQKSETKNADKNGSISKGCRRGA